MSYNVHKMSKELFYHLFPVCYFINRFSVNSCLQDAIGTFSSYKADKQLSDGASLLNTTSAYLVKSSAWQHEKEWRIVVPHIYMFESFKGDQKVFEEDVCPEQYSISDPIIEFPYVSAVTLGPRISMYKKEHIMEICQYKKNIELYETRMVSNKFALEKRCIYGNGDVQWHF